MKAEHGSAAQLSSLHLPSLATGLLVMLLATLYPPLFQHAGRVDHGLAAALFCAMSAGLVRGVGFVPHQPVLRWLFSGWSCCAALLLALALRL